MKRREKEAKSFDLFRIDEIHQPPGAKIPINIK
jgi:hypothetical protein